LAINYQGYFLSPFELDNLLISVGRLGKQSQKQWDAIYEDLVKQFWYEPPLKPKVVYKLT
jgi:hypothetical protein